jgi:hypothetical protein
MLPFSQPGKSSGSVVRNYEYPLTELSNFSLDCSASIPGDRAAKADILKWVNDGNRDQV